MRIGSIQAQNPPLYGAERRGTAIVAFARVSPSIVLEGPDNFRHRQHGVAQNRQLADRPVIYLDDCNGCAICYARCPEGDIRMDADDKPVIDYDHCKGCLIGRPGVPSTPLKLSGRWASWHGTDTENLLVSEHRLNYSSK